MDHAEEFVQGHGLGNKETSVFYVEDFTTILNIDCCFYK